MFYKIRYDKKDSKISGVFFILKNEFQENHLKIETFLGEKVIEQCQTEANSRKQVRFIAFSLKDKKVVYNNDDIKEGA